MLKKCGFLLMLVLALMLGAGAATAEIFYSASDYSTSSVGLIGKSGAGEYDVNSNLVTNFGMDSRAFAFEDHNGDPRAMVREYNFGPGDSVYIWDPSDWKTPIKNVSDWGTNIHAVTSDAGYLYLATHSDSTDSGPGEIVKIDMKNGYKVVGRYKHDTHSVRGKTYTSHAEAISVIDGKVYALFVYGNISGYSVDYIASQIVVMDEDMEKTDVIKLEDGVAGTAAKNSLRMARHGDKLFVASLGGAMGSGAWGDVWEVDTAAVTAKRVLDASEISAFKNPVGVEGITSAPDGTVYLLFGGYDADWNYEANLYVTTASELSRGDAGAPAPDFLAKGGYAWDIRYDEFDEVLWCLAGSGIELRDKSGKIQRVFAPGQLGDNGTSIAVIGGTGVVKDDTVKPVEPVVPSHDGLSAVQPDISLDKSSVAATLAVLMSEDKIVVNSYGALVLDDGFALDQASEVWDDADKVVSLPIFSAVPAKSGDVTAVGFELTGEKLMASRPEDIKLIKIRGEWLEPLEFKYVSKPADYADGCFTVQRDGAVWTGNMSAGSKYVLVLFIKDDGRFDLDPAEKSVLDPTVIVKTATQEDGGGSSGGGGCDMGGASVLALLAVAVLSRSMRKCTVKK